MSDKRIVPFKVAIEDAVLSDLKHRLHKARWVGDFANADWKYGANAGCVRDLAEHWRDTYDWRTREALMNRFDHFRTEIREIPIHFLHIRGKGPAPRPLIMSHGWPSSFWDFHKVIAPLTDPVAHGGKQSDAFDVVVPSLPGYGFSSPLCQTGINFSETADLWIELMDRLGYARFAAQGCDWGAFIAGQLGHKYADKIVGLHLDMQVRLDAFSGGLADPENYAADEQDLLDANRAFLATETGYMHLQTTKPQTPAFGLNDSPIGLLAWIVEKWHRWSDGNGHLPPRLTRDEIIDTVMIYWVTQTVGTAARYYYEAAHCPWTPSHDRVPVIEAPTCAVRYPGELYHEPEAFIRRYHNLQARPLMPEGAHFPQMEVPDTFVNSLRNFFHGRGF